MLSTKNFIALVIISLLSVTSAYAENISKEEMFSRLSSLASSGDSDVKYNLGMFLNNGIGTPRDNKAAFKYFSEAAESGHELASYKVGCYLAGQFPGTVQVNKAEALKYKLRAAEAGYDLAQFDVGIHYGKMHDAENAILWWERASRQGNVEATAYLANYLTSPSSPNQVKGYAVILILKELMPSPPKSLLDSASLLETKLTTEQKSEADSIRTSWITGKTPLTLKANAGMSLVPALIK